MSGGAEEWTTTSDVVRDLHRALVTSEVGPPGSGSDDGGIAASQTLPTFLPSEESARPKPPTEPGGFRREFLRRRAEQAGEPIDEAWDESLLDRIDSSLMISRLASLSAMPFGYQFDDDGNRVRTAERRVKADASDMEVAIAIFKSFVAEGIMFLPAAFMNGGWLLSSVVMLAVAYASKVGVFMLIECYAVLPGTLGDIAQEAAGGVGRMAVEVSLVVSQFAICCAMLIFVLRTSEVAIVPGASPEESHAFRLRCLAVCLLALVPLNWVRNLSKLALSNLVANACVLFGVAISIVYLVRQLALAGVPSDVTVAKPSTIAIFLGTTCYAFEGIPLVLPVYESMRNKRHFGRVFSWVFWVGVAGLETAYGLVGYLAFGEHINPVSILSIPLTAFTRTVLLLFGAAIVLGFPMMFVPASRIFESYIWAGPASGGSGGAPQPLDPQLPHVRRAALVRKVLKNLLRTGLVLALCAISLYGADFVSQFVALAGSLCCVPLAFVYPAYFHLRLVAKTASQRAAAWALITGGLVLMPLTLYQVVFASHSDE